MQQSNIYILVFTVLMTLVLGSVLSFTSVTLRPLQEQQEALDTKKKILKAVTDISDITKDAEAVTRFYTTHVQSLVLNTQGETQEQDGEGIALIAERINVRKNHKRDPQTRYFPVYLYKEDSTSELPDAYIFPMFGAGLWDWISGYIALDQDLNTVLGVVFDHKTETPGLGARIASKQVQRRYQGKKIFNVTSGALESVSMIKGERGLPLGEHQVDGMSGATMTANGVNNMLQEYLQYYMPYIQRMQRQTLSTTTNSEAYAPTM